MGTRIVLDFDTLSDSDARRIMKACETTVANSIGYPRTVFHGGAVQESMPDDEYYDGSSMGGCV